MLDRAVRSFAQASVARGFRTWHVLWVSIVEALRVARATLTRWAMREMARALQTWEEFAQTRLAAQAVARQLRLRNLGGIIIIDFIDMTDAEHRRQVLRTLEKSLAKDHAKTTVYDFSPLGLVEMTRKRTRESLGHILTAPCPTCSGRGAIKTVETVCLDILREICRSSRQFEANGFLIIAAPKVIQRLFDEQSQGLAELEEQLQRPIKLQAEASYLPEHFDVVPL